MGVNNRRKFSKLKRLWQNIAWYILLPLIVLHTLVINANAQNDDKFTYFPVVLEMYTSQGCTSCPPADEIIINLKNGILMLEDIMVTINPDVILPLVFHVDYWNYLGWKDTFSKKEFTDRQKAYAKSIGSSMIYTPQAIVQGTYHMVGSRTDHLKKALDMAVDEQDYDISKITINRQGDQVNIENLPNDIFKKNIQLMLVAFDPRVKNVTINAGENRNKKIAYTNIVTDVYNLNKVDGEIDIPESSCRNIALLLHSENMTIVDAWANIIPDEQNC